VIGDLAVILADGDECVSDLGAVRNRQVLFGQVASDFDGVSGRRRCRLRAVVGATARSSRPGASGSGSRMARPSG
jgi:hypothetical protein